MEPYYLKHQSWSPPHAPATMWQSQPHSAPPLSWIRDPSPRQHGGGGKALHDSKPSMSHSPSHGHNKGLVVVPRRSARIAGRGDRRAPTRRGGAPYETSTDCHTSKKCTEEGALCHRSRWIYECLGGQWTHMANLPKDGGSKQRTSSQRRSRSPRTSKKGGSSLKTTVQKQRRMQSSSSGKAAHKHKRSTKGGSSSTHVKRQGGDPLSTIMVVNKGPNYAYAAVYLIDVVRQCVSSCELLKNAMRATLLPVLIPPNNLTPTDPKTKAVIGTPVTYKPLGVRQTIGNRGLILRAVPLVRPEDPNPGLKLLPEVLADDKNTRRIRAGGLYDINV